MRHFDAWVIRDPYSIWHYYTTGQRWKDTVRELIHDRKICAPSLNSIDPYPSSSSSSPSSTATISSSSSSSTPSTTVQQTSPLFTRLPPEIRAIIWSYVFDAETIHLVTIKNKVRHVRCSSPATSTTSLTNHRHCCPTTLARWRTPSTTTTNINSSPNTNLLYPHTNPTLPSTLTTSTPPPPPHLPRHLHRNIHPPLQKHHLRHRRPLHLHRIHPVPTPPRAALHPQPHNPMDTHLDPSLRPRP
ncbi:uncharacterized protein N7458_011679 [Penicillium daleae]|uniref:DUF7730 domain-containing protein n=1 Tax=Penicillium daleae TaxID=63821 RepID=A0AAD6FWI0_9EURO|nr:uncharacterized protein N7458_011679 [Penicillium daleae]KAJ5432523.1 hypothetical protein N7458_011679 [Penicillium daleae]